MVAEAAVALELAVIEELVKSGIVRNLGVLLGVGLNVPADAGGEVRFENDDLAVRFVVTGQAECSDDVCGRGETLDGAVGMDEHFLVFSGVAVRSAEAVEVESLNLDTSSSRASAMASPIVRHLVPRRRPR